MVGFTILLVFNQQKEETELDEFSDLSIISRLLSTSLVILLAIWVLSQVIRIYLMSQWYLDILYERYEFNLRLGIAVTRTAFVVFFLVCILFPAVLVYLAVFKLL